MEFEVHDTCWLASLATGGLQPLLAAFGGYWLFVLLATYGGYWRFGLLATYGGYWRFGLLWPPQRPKVASRERSEPVANGVSQ